MPDNNSEKYYKKIRNALMLPKGNKDILKILKFWFKPEEAKILSVFKAAMMSSYPLEKIAKKVKEPEEKVKKILEDLAKKGLVFTWINKKSNEKMYTVPMLFPGLFEWYFASKHNDPEELKKAAKIFKPLEDTFIAFASRYPISRVAPSIEPLKKTIEINKSVYTGKSKVMLYEDVRKILENSKRIAVMPCPCRTFHGILGDSCGKPIDVCINLNSSADYVVREGIGRELTIDEAIDVLKMAEKSGLVHVINNQSDKHSFICNCCGCCCGFLGNANKFKLIDNMIAKSNYIPVIDSNKCTLCKTCINKCPVNALFVNYGSKEDLSDSYVHLREDICIGCGVCSVNCPSNAIILKKVGDTTEDDLESQLWEAGARSRSEKIF
ncbi:MAG: 4Fe-4S dicluster domain-containing protein [Promethearchaeota archaeon]|nr:MAG: 4Fe-4S dicluster domain-containing protein [Candidatus Lokiarchaeota archaeon]